MIKTNRVGVDIDGTVYQLYNMNFGFQRRMVEVQSNISKLQNKLAKEYGVNPDEVSTSDKVPAEQKVELAAMGLQIADVVKSLFVNPEEAAIVDNFDMDNLTELIGILQ